MAKFNGEIDTDTLKQLQSRDQDANKMMSEMVQAGAEVAIGNVQTNMGRSFSNTRHLLAGLRITRTYRTPSDDGINAKVGFWGTHPTKKDGAGRPVALALIAMAREYGTVRGERAVPFFRRSFNKGAINSAMEGVQRRYGVKE